MENVEGKTNPSPKDPNNEDKFFVLKQILGRTWNADEQRHLYKVQWEDLSTGEFFSLPTLFQQYLVSLFRCNSLLES